MTDFVVQATDGDDTLSSEALLGPDLWHTLEQLEESTNALEYGPKVIEVKESLASYEDISKGCTSHFVVFVDPTAATQNDILLVSVSALQDDHQTYKENAETCRIFVRRGKGEPGSPLLSECAGESRFDSQWNPEDGFTRDGERFVAISLDRTDAAGAYYIAVEHIGTHSAQMSVKCGVTYVQAIEAVGLPPNATIRGENGTSEFTYYRFVNTQPDALITIHARPAFDEDGEPIGDPDLYVSNVANGQGRLDRERYVWKSCNVGADRVEVHPGDSSARMGNTYLIGVLGYKERNVFDVEVKVTPPLPIVELAINSSVEFTARSDSYCYFKFRVDPERRSQLRLKLYATDDPDGCNGLDDDGFDAGGPDSEAEEQDLVQTFGRGIYTADLSQYQLTEEQLSKMDNENRPIMYISCCVMYPTAEDTTMRAISPEGPANALLECDEWKYNGDFCYVGVRLQSWLDMDGCSAAGSSTRAQEERPCKIVVSEREEIQILPPPLRDPFRAWTELFGDVDGGSVSQHDRSELDKHGNSSFTYGEVEFVSFSKLLAKCDVQPGASFVDLGSGTGKAVFAAAFGGHGFGRCVGIELLPSLHKAAEELKDRVTGARSDTLSRLLSFSLPSIELIAGDMTIVDWSYADVVYTSSICFTDELLEKIGKLAARMKRGSKFCTLKVWPNAEDHFSVVYNGWFKMSWGRICVHILERK
mmetsp:Transcript_8898/g.33596  ORF Transcript_8898/g.33596 Transcript_8898/m.33596 type:complete len:703 (-) Transcript_8898:231-2339(-)